MLRALDDGADWSAPLPSTDLVLLPAACYPLYPLLKGRLPEGGRLFDVLGTCFRHEPSDDPARMQSFHQHEFVHVGTPDTALAFRNRWLERSQEMMRDLGLRPDAEVANDPFFGRVGSMLAANQREERAQVRAAGNGLSPEERTAIVLVQLPSRPPHRPVRDHDRRRRRGALRLRGVRHRADRAGLSAATVWTAIAGRTTCETDLRLMKIRLLPVDAATSLRSELHGEDRGLDGDQLLRRSVDRIA